jgi:HAD superfamily hydrolase (TIGR01509 family)
MKRIKAAIFDLDGVVFDTEPIHRKAWIQSLRTLGHKISEESLMEWTGIPCRSLAERYSETLEPHLNWQVYQKRKAEALHRIARDELVPFAGVPEALVKLSDSIKLCYATSNYHEDAELMLDFAGLSHILTSGVTYEDIDRHKPEPDAYLKAAELVGIEVDCCIAIEDSPAGVASAIAAGMRVCAVATTFSAIDLKEATKTFKSTIEACSWLSELVLCG